MSSRWRGGRPNIAWNELVKCDGLAKPASTAAVVSLIALATEALLPAGTAARRRRYSGGVHW